MSSLKKCDSSHLPIQRSRYLFLAFSVVGILYIFWILVLCHDIFAMFSTISKVAFYSLDHALMLRSFKFSFSPDRSGLPYCLSFCDWIISWISSRFTCLWATCIWTRVFLLPGQFIVWAKKASSNFIYTFPFPSGSFIVSALTLRSLIQFELIF